MRILYLAWLFSLLTVLSFAQDKIPVKLSGVAFLDYYYNIDHFADSLKDLNGFQFRRIFFTADFTISDAFSSRFRLEADQSALTSNGRIGVFVKDAFFKLKDIFSGSDLVAGISPTPSFQVSEEVWSYRSLEKTIMDLRNIVSSRDFGIDLMGKLTPGGSINYWFKIANNSGNSPETNKYKRYYALLHFKPFKYTELSISGDYDTRPGIFDAGSGTSLNNNRITGAVFAGVKNPGNFAIGIESYIRNINNNFRNPETVPGSGTKSLADEKAMGTSLFGWLALSGKVYYIARLDVNDPNSEKDNDANLYIITGVDYHPHSNVKIIPNIYAQFYENNNKRDVIGRITIHLSL